MRPQCLFLHEINYGAEFQKKIYKKKEEGRERPIERDIDRERELQSARGNKNWGSP